MFWCIETGKTEWFLMPELTLFSTKYAHYIDNIYISVYVIDIRILAPRGHGMPTSQNKITAINIRAQKEQRALIDKAASSLNKTRSDFMLEVACQAAENVLLDQRLFLVDEALNVFQDQLDAPVADNERLHYLLNRNSPWEN